MTTETGDGMHPAEWPGAARPTSWFLSAETPRQDGDEPADGSAAGTQEPGDPPGWQHSGISWEHNPPANEPRPDSPVAAWPQPAAHRQAPSAFGAPVFADAPPRYPTTPPRRSRPQPPAPDPWAAEPDPWEPRRLPYPELPSTPIRRRTHQNRKTRRRVTPMTFVRLGVPAVLLAGVAAVAMMMLAGHAGQNLADRSDQTRPAASDPAQAGSAAAVEFSQVNAAGDGDTVVAVGSQSSATPSFRVSADGGHTWTTAVVRSQAGPVTGHAATMVAGGPGGWVGLGPNAVWTSANGQAWTLVSAHGLAAPGETITGLIKDSWGYLASGTRAGSSTGGLVWTSPNGLTWHQHTAAQFGLVDTHGEQVFAMTDAATDWNVTLVAGSATLGGKTCAYVWRSLDLGASWRTVVVPQTHGASWSFAGLAGDAGHYIAVRPGTAAGGVPEAVVYTSSDAINWHFATTITGLGGFTPEQVTGGSGRFVVTGHNRQGQEVAYTSTDNGTTWTPSDGFGVLPAD